jgi:hypothetical protein
MELNRMSIDRPMVQLFFQIKRLMPTESQQNMKIASPDIAEQLIDIYVASKNASIRTLIELFMERAGNPWTAKLKNLH